MRRGKGQGRKGNLMEGARTDEAKPHYKHLGRPYLSVYAVCAPKNATGSNEPRKCFGRSGHLVPCRNGRRLETAGHLKACQNGGQLGMQ